jgi:hypothetical protein
LGEPENAENAPAFGYHRAEVDQLFDRQMEPRSNVASTTWPELWRSWDDVDTGLRKHVPSDRYAVEI